MTIQGKSCVSFPLSKGSSSRELREWKIDIPALGPGLPARADSTAMVNETFDQSPLAGVSSFRQHLGLHQEERWVRRDRVPWSVPQRPHLVSALELPRQGKSTSSLLASLAILAFLATGCDQIGERASKAVEARVQKETSDLLEKTMGSVDKTINSVGSRLAKNGSRPKVVAHDSLLASGISLTSLAIRETPERMAAVYCTLEKPLDSRLEARFLDMTGAEIGRVQQRVNAKAGAGLFIEFPIDPRTNIQDILTVSVRKP